MTARTNTAIAQAILVFLVVAIGIALHSCVSKKPEPLPPVMLKSPAIVLVPKPVDFFKPNPDLPTNFR